jgi:hypothetical protein
MKTTLQWQRNGALIFVGMILVGICLVILPTFLASSQSHDRTPPAKAFTVTFSISYDSVTLERAAELECQVKQIFFAANGIDVAIGERPKPQPIKWLNVDTIKIGTWPHWLWKEPIYDRLNQDSVGLDTIGKIAR